MRKIKINPKYEYLRAFLESIPDVFEKEGRVIYTGRNLIKVMEVPDGTVINVKRYHAPKGPNSAFIYHMDKTNSFILGISESQKVNEHSNIL